MLECKHYDGVESSIINKILEEDKNNETPVRRAGLF